jgi:hypothetical protein
MPENQLHGFTWEAEIKTNVFGLDAAAPYTAVHDIDRSQNRFDANENISIKTTGGSTVCMGDALRILDYEPGVLHTAIVVQYKQCADSKIIMCVYELDLGQRELLWGQVTREDVAELDALVRSMPRRQRVPEIDAAITAKKTELNAKSGLLKFNPKIDSKTQRRLQCSIPKFAEAPTLVRTITRDPVVRGVPITASLPSGRRQRHG